MYLLVILQRVKHSKIADGIEVALDSKKFLQPGMDSDQVRTNTVIFFFFFCFYSSISMTVHHYMYMTTG